MIPVLVLKSTAPVYKRVIFTNQGKAKHVLQHMSKYCKAYFHIAHEISKSTLTSSKNLQKSGFFSLNISRFLLLCVAHAHMKRRNGFFLLLDFVSLTVTQAQYFIARIF